MARHLRVRSSAKAEALPKGAAEPLALGERGSGGSALGSWIPCSRSRWSTASRSLAWKR
jgi:hypothetical protein